MTALRVKSSLRCEHYEALREHDFPVISALGNGLHAASFSVMKMFSARSIVEDGIVKGKIQAGTRIVESTSGTFGLALAMLKPYFGYELTLISDPVIDAPLKRKLELMGAVVDIVDSPKDGSYQLARLARVREVMERDKKAYFADQYYNPANAAGYARLADWLAARFPRIDRLVGAVGTGGSMCGTAARLRQYFPALKVTGVDTPNSVIFGQPNGPRALRGLGNSLVPGNVDHTLFDEVHWISAPEAYLSCRELLTEHGLFMGGTSGAAWLAARWHAAQNPEETTLVILPDDGHRYIETVYDDTHCRSLPGWSGHLPEAPKTLQNPADVITGWFRITWNRRQLPSRAGV